MCWKYSVFHFCSLIGKHKDFLTAEIFPNYGSFSLHIKARLHKAGQMQGLRIRRTGTPLSGMVLHVSVIHGPIHWGSGFECAIIINMQKNYKEKSVY